MASRDNHPEYDEDRVDELDVDEAQLAISANMLQLSDELMADLHTPDLVDIDGSGLPARAVDSEVNIPMVNSLPSTPIEDQYRIDVRVGCDADDYVVADVIHGNEKPHDVDVEHLCDCEKNQRLFHSRDEVTIPQHEGTGGDKMELTDLNSNDRVSPHRQTIGASNASNTSNRSTPIYIPSAFEYSDYATTIPTSDLAAGSMLDCACSKNDEPDGGDLVLSEPWLSNGVAAGMHDFSNAVVATTSQEFPEDFGSIQGAVPSLYEVTFIAPSPIPEETPPPNMEGEQTDADPAQPPSDKAPSPAPTVTDPSSEPHSLTADGPQEGLSKNSLLMASVHDYPVTGAVSELSRGMGTLIYHVGQPDSYNDDQVPKTLSKVPEVGSTGETVQNTVANSEDGNEMTGAAINLSAYSSSVDVDVDDGSKKGTVRNTPPPTIAESGFAGFEVRSAPTPRSKQSQEPLSKFPSVYKPNTASIPRIPSASRDQKEEMEKMEMARQASMVKYPAPMLRMSKMQAMSARQSQYGVCQTHWPANYKSRSAQVFTNNMTAEVFGMKPGKVVRWDEANNARPPLRIDMDSPSPCTYSPHLCRPLNETIAPSFTMGRRTFVEKPGGARTSWTKTWFQSPHVYHQKADFSSDRAWPSPYHYPKRPMLGPRQITVTGFPAFSIGVRREDCLKFEKKDSTHEPAPGTYDPINAERLVKPRHPSVTHGVRTGGTVPWASNEKTPGPAHYSPRDQLKNSAFTIRGVRKTYDSAQGPFSVAI